MKRGEPPEVSTLPVVLIESDALLREVCVRFSADRQLALDTEFVSERTYVPQLELVQIASGTECALVDCRAVQDLQPLFDLLADARVEKIFHAGQQDIDLFSRLSGNAPRPVFDTQIAAAMAGFGSQPGYAHLVERLVGIQLDKTETLTDWTRRPFTPAQIAYAADDVRYLLPVYEELRRKLVELQRWEWLDEELGRTLAAVPAEDSGVAEAYVRVRGRGTLRAKGLAVLRELAEWREEVARELNRPRSSVVKDEALVEISRKAPTTVAALRGLRAVRSRELDRNAEQVIARVAVALASPRESWPEPPPARRSTVPTGVVELLQAVLRSRAESAHVASSLIATSSELQELAERYDSQDLDGLRLLRGWRREIVGEELLALLHGRATVKIDPRSGELRVRNTSAEPKTGAA